MPSRALFYPNWSISDPKFLFESLLYWDRLGCIVPDGHFKPWHHVWSDDEGMRKALAEANEFFVTPIHPTPEQKERAHEKIEEFAVHRAPKSLRPAHFSSDDRAVVSSLKLAPKTVELLRQNKWMREGAGQDMNEISSAAGNLVMAAVAEECSSKEMPPVTDDPTGFVASCDLVLSKVGIPRGVILGREDEAANAPGEDVSFLLEGIPYLALEGRQVNHLMLEKLIDARDKPDIAGLRERFRERVDTFLADLRDAEAPQRQVIRDSFKDAVKQDLASLKSDLRLAGVETLCTKEGVAAIVLGGLLGTAAASPGVGTIVGLFTGLFAYRKTRRENLEKHWTSWLFGAEHPRFSIV